VRYGLGAIKGTGAGAIEAIVAAREGRDGQGGGPFRSLFDFCARVDRGRVNKRVVEALIRAGAFDALHPGQGAGHARTAAAVPVDPYQGRAELLASVGLAFDWADTQAANETQGGLFDFGDDSHGSSRQEPALVAAEPLGVRERLQHEKLAIGFHLSGHLFDACADEVRRFCRRPIAELVDSREPVLVAGIVGALRVVNGRSGRVLIFRLDDGSESIEAVLADEDLQEQRELLKEDELVIVQGRAQPDRFAGGLRLNVQQAWDLAAARARFGRYLAVEVGAAMPPVAELVRLAPARRVTREHGEHGEHGEEDALTQGLAVRLRLQREGAVAEIELGDEGRIWPSDEALARWQAAAHERRAVVIYE
jgi:DNA polymerase-3 subunit alpha